MRLLYLILIITSLYACTSQTNAPDINGHWHLYHFSSKDTLTYLKLDIKNDTVATLEGVNMIQFGKPIIYLKNIRNINKEKKAMMLWMEGSYERFDYEILNDTLFLKEFDTQTKRSFYGLKKVSKLCDFWEHQYSDKSMKIELAELGASDEIIIKKASIPFNIYAGIDKIKGNPTIEVGEWGMDINELPLAFEQFKAMLRSSDQDSFSVVLNTHKDLPLEFVEELTAKLDAIPTKEIYYRKVTEDKKIVLTKQ